MLIFQYSQKHLCLIYMTSITSFDVKMQNLRAVINVANLAPFQKCNDDRNYIEDITLKTFESTTGENYFILSLVT